MWINKKLGFTLIEVIIAIAVFSIGVIAVLNLIIYNLSTIDKVQTQITATILAKEWLELTYNIRDTNIQKWFARDCLLAKWVDSEIEIDDVCSSHFASGDAWAVFQFGFDPRDYYWHTSTVSWSFDELFDQNALYYYTGKVWDITLFWYGHTQDWLEWSATPFARYIVFKPLKEWGITLPSDKILKVESHVLYKKWSYQWDIVLESFMGHF